MKFPRSSSATSNGNQATCVAIHRALVEIGGEGRAGTHALAVHKTRLTESGDGGRCIRCAGPQNFEYVRRRGAGRDLSDALGRGGRRHVVAKIQHRLRGISAGQACRLLRTHKHEQDQHAQNDKTCNGPFGHVMWAE